MLARLVTALYAVLPIKVVTIRQRRWVGSQCVYSVERLCRLQLSANQCIIQVLISWSNTVPNTVASLPDARDRSQAEVVMFGAYS